MPRRVSDEELLAATSGPLDPNARARGLDLKPVVPIVIAGLVLAVLLKGKR